MNGSASHFPIFRSHKPVAYTLTSGVRCSDTPFAATGAKRIDKRDNSLSLFQQILTTRLALQRLVIIEHACNVILVHIITSSRYNSQVLVHFYLCQVSSFVPTLGTLGSLGVARP